MSKKQSKEAELTDIGKKLGRSQSKDALIKLLLVRCHFAFYEKEMHNLIREILMLRHTLEECRKILQWRCKSGIRAF